MNPWKWTSPAALAFSLLLVISVSAQKIKVIVDQDGPGTSDQQAILVFLQAEKFDVLGITTVSGDQWVTEETQHVLRLLEIANRTNVPVIAGAEFPLLNSKEESERWEAMYGKFEHKGLLDRTFRGAAFRRFTRSLITLRTSCLRCRRANPTSRRLQERPRSSA